MNTDIPFKNIIINLFNPFENQIYKKYVYCYNAPPNIRNILQKQSINSTNRTQLKVLQKYYGKLWKQEIGIDTNYDNIIINNYLTAAKEEKIVGKKDKQIEDIDLEDIDDIEIDNLNEVSDENDINIFEDVDFDDDADIVPDIIEHRKVDTQTLSSKISSKYIEYLFDLPENQNKGTDIFLRDNFWDLRHKIYLLTNIPIYRQNLFAINPNINNNIIVPFQISLNNNDIKHSMKNDTYNIYDINIDKLFYLNRNNIHTIAEEEIRILLLHVLRKTNNFYVIDLDFYKNQLNPYINKILNNQYEFEMIYYGLIKKYYPMLNIEMFQLYLTDESKIWEKYPLLTPVKNDVLNKYVKQNKILLKLQKIIGTLVTKHGTSLNISIKNMLISSNETIIKKNLINIRLLFDIFKTNEKYPIIQFVSIHDNKLQRITKQYQNFIQQNPEKLNVINFDTIPYNTNYASLKIYINDINLDSSNSKQKKLNESKQMFFYLIENGQYHIYGEWYEETNKKYKDVIDILVNEGDELIEQINNYESVFNILCVNNICYRLNPLSLEQYSIDSVNIILFWDRVITYSDFNIISDYLQKYIDSGIIRLKSSKLLNIINTRFTKAMYDYKQTLKLSKGIETSDYYLVYQQATIYDQFVKTYGNKKLIVSNNITSLKFEVVNLNIYEYSSAISIILLMIDELQPLLGKSKIQEFKGAKIEIKKLLEIDPALYDFSKYTNEILYTRVVQKKYRPKIYSETEYNILTEGQKKNLIKYYNFTTGENVYYACTNPKLPFFTFVAGKHPKNYCIPKCTEKPNEGIKMKLIYNKCMNEYIVDPNELEEISKATKNILLYESNNLKDNKYYYLPDEVYKLFYNIKNKDFIFYTMQQQYKNLTHFSVINILSLVYNKSQIDILDDMHNRFYDKKYLNKLGVTENELFSSMTVAAYYDKSQDIFNDIYYYIKNEDCLLNHSLIFDEFLEQIMNRFYNIYYITLLDIENSTEYTELYNKENIEVNSNILLYYQKKIKNDLINSIDHDYIFVMVQNHNSYPVYYKNDILINTKHILIKTLQNKINLKEFNDNILLTKEEALLNKFSYDNIKKLGKIESKYILDIFISSVMINYNKKLINFGIYGSDIVNDNIPNIYKLYDRKKFNVNFADTLNFLFSFHDELPTFVCLLSEKEIINCTKKQNKIQIENYTVIGININSIYSWFTNTTLEEILIYFQTKSKFNTKFNISDLDDLPIQILAVDPYDVNKTIIEKGRNFKSELKEITKVDISFTVYKNNIYKLFKNEIYYQLIHQHESKIRKTIIKDIKSSDFDKNINYYKNKIYNILQNENDIYILTDLLNFYQEKKYTIEDLLNNLSVIVFNFDKYHIIDIIKEFKSTNDIQRYLHKLSQKIVQLVPTKDYLNYIKKHNFDEAQFYNILINCGITDKSKTLFCSNKKIIIIKEYYNKFLDLLANDLQNTFMLTYDLNNLELSYILNYNEYNRYAGETITFEEI